MDEREEFSVFVDHHARGLHRTAYLLTGDWHSAEDLVQTTLVTAWQRWDEVREPAARLGYVRQVMMRTFLRWRRRRWNGEISTGWQPEGDTTPDVFAAVEHRDPLLRAVRCLPLMQRAVVVLRYFDDQSERSTAELLGCSVGTVKSHASRALRTLRAMPQLQYHTNEGAP